MPETSKDNSAYPGTNVPDKIIVHHSAYGGNAFQYPLINEWHKQRGFPLSKLGSYVGYHYVIEKDGSYTQCRDEGEGGAHTVGENFSSIGVCLAGNYNVEDPTPAQEKTLAKILYMMQERHAAILATNIFPHRHFNQTDCYGTRLTDTYAQEVFAQQLITDEQNGTLESELMHGEI